MEAKTVDGFYQDEFDIEKFLNEEMKRKELQSILKALVELKQRNSYTMSNVLKEQTDSVILIAEQLQSLYKKIDSLNVPILQLREEVKVLNQDSQAARKYLRLILGLQMLQAKVSEAVHTFDQNISQYQYLFDVKYRIQELAAFRGVLRHTNVLLTRCYGDSDFDLECLQRVIDKYALYNDILSTLGIEHPSDEHHIDKQIQNLLANKFLKSFRENRANSMRTFIEMYIYLRKAAELTELIRQDIIKPLLQPILCEENLRSCKSLNKLYQDALGVLKTDLKGLILLTKLDDIKEFNIILDCYWVVVDNLLRKNLLSITAAGHADVFFTNFTETWRFLGKIAEAYGDKAVVNQDASFVSHLKRFNLLVYYEIRHQEVSSVFETIILQCSSGSSNNFYASGSRFKLRVSLVLYLQILYLIHRNIFLPLLSDQFLKSCLLLVSRYITWIEAMIEKIKLNDEEARRDVLICFLCDLNTLKHKMAFEIRDSLSLLLNATSLVYMQEIVECCGSALDRCYSRVRKGLVDLIVVNASETLRGISNIPRLYRRTNKNLPEKPSEYVEVALKPILDFERKLGNSFEEKASILDDIINQCTVAYSVSCSAVFIQVCKTEESLLKLKSKNQQSVDSNSSENSDISKIRLQIKLDVAHFSQQLTKYASDETRKQLQEFLAQS